MVGSLVIRTCRNMVLESWYLYPVTCYSTVVEQGKESSTAGETVQKSIKESYKRGNARLNHNEDKGNERRDRRRMFPVVSDK